MERERKKESELKFDQQKGNRIIIIISSGNIYAISSSQLLLSLSLAVLWKYNQLN